MNIDSRSKYLCVALMLACLPAMAAETESRKDHKEYDFHYDIRYPGRLRSDVGRDNVSQEKAKDLKGYHRRVVEWWPKRGVDFTPLEDIPGDGYPDWPMLITTGAGRFCGVNLQVWNPNAFGRAEPRSMANFDGYGENVTKHVDQMNRWWWGEGDEKFFVDGEKFPSTFGTGSEKYHPNHWPLLYHCTAYWYQQAGESDPYGPVGLEARGPRACS